MKARYIREIGTLGSLRVYWDEIVVDAIEPCVQCSEGHPTRRYLNSCPNAYGRGKPGGHNALREVGRSDKLEDWEAFGKESDYGDDRWPAACSHCGAPAPLPSLGPSGVGESGIVASRQVFTSRLYDTASGSPEPGDVYATSFHDPGECPFWDNCDGVHWHGVLPNGSEWDIDSRCSNCTLRDDRTHRCWTRTGSPEAGSLSAGKGGGPTCAAGAGSIAVPGWHGFLTDFTWVSC